LCTAQVRLCSDTTQCVVAGYACVDGLCEPRCDASSGCDTGYSCDLTRGVCNINPSPCRSSATCQGGTICIEEHCVPPCGLVGDGGASCPSGRVCVNGGCIPDQGAKFACANDGESDLLANQCPGFGAICLHHDCYAACASDGGGCNDPTPVCKTVTIETGIYAVCGTATNLGSDCDPAQGKRPPGCDVCIDGYCR
jgi:hypothetical protein